MKCAYIDLSNGRLHYRYCGQGQPIIMIHMSGSSSDEFEKVGDYLSDRFSVYALDLPGFGFSYRPEQYYSIEQYRDTIIDFIKALSIKDAILVGNLVGANIVARVAEHRPDLVKSLALFQFIYNTDYNAFRSFRDIPAFSEVVPAADGSHLNVIWSRVCGTSWNSGDTIPTEVLNARAICMMLAGRFSEAMHWAIFEDKNYDEILPNIKTPAIVFALEDHSFAGVQPEVVKLLPNATLCSLKKAGSYLPRIDPERYASIIKEHF